MCLKLCKSKEIILNGKKILIRRPKYSDLKSFLEYINSLVKEDAMINVNRKVTLKEESEWLKKTLASIIKNKSHDLVGYYDGEIIGYVGVTKQEFRLSHTARFGITIKRNYRNIGLATALSKTMIDIAKKDSQIKILYLDVINKNKAAMKLYKKIGFKKVALLSNIALYKGKYLDTFVMDYPLRKI